MWCYSFWQRAFSRRDICTKSDVVEVAKFLLTLIDWKLGLVAVGGRASICNSAHHSKASDPSFSLLLKNCCLFDGEGIKSELS